MSNFYGMGERVDESGRVRHFSFMSTLTIRAATPDDVPLILEFIRGLAEYEKLSHEVTTTEGGLRESLFGEKAVAEVRLGYTEHEPVCIAVYFHNFSTFLGRNGLYLEDLFVKPEFRGKGYGKAMLSHLAALARERGCGRFEWSVLDWNEPAIGFYKKLGATVMPEWRICRVTGDALERLGQG